MKKFLCILAVATAFAGVQVQARPHGGGHGGGHHHGGDGGLFLGGIIGGVILGEIIDACTYRPAPRQVVYVEPKPVYVEPKPVVIQQPRTNYVKVWVPGYRVLVTSRNGVSKYRWVPGHYEVRQEAVEYVPYEGGYIQR